MRGQGQWKAGNTRAPRGGPGRRLTGQVALVDAVHFVGQSSQLTGPQSLDEGLHPAAPPLQAVEEVPNGVLVPLVVEVGPQQVLEDTALLKPGGRTLSPLQRDNCRKRHQAAPRGRQSTETGTEPRARPGFEFKFEDSYQERGCYCVLGALARGSA